MTLVNIRPSPIAGTWYEGDPVRLARAVDAYLDAAHVPALDGETVAVIAPHAGHRYSGPVAGYAFAALRGRTFERVAVVSPFHNLILKSELGFGLSPIARDREHSLEIELPFLQRVLTGGFSLIPVMIRGQEPAVARGLGLALAQVLKDKNALLVASTDLSHFYDQQTANRLDAEMLKRFESFQPEKIFEAERTGKGFACGHAAVA
ncbi:MAG: AmmeMemoRadiSam system protein B, partial [Anaerolineales bacterium]|nr:AmmeMemoRadiSam system protein B [Anaerolineales bacterium]